MISIEISVQDSTDRLRSQSKTASVKWTSFLKIFKKSFTFIIWLNRFIFSEKNKFENLLMISCCRNSYLIDLRFSTWNRFFIFIPYWSAIFQKWSLFTFTTYTHSVEFYISITGFKFWIIRIFRYQIIVFRLTGICTLDTNTFWIPNTWRDFRFWSKTFVMIYQQCKY